MSTIVLLDHKNILCYAVLCLFALCGKGVSEIALVTKDVGYALSECKCEN